MAAATPSPAPEPPPPPPPSLAPPARPAAPPPQQQPAAAGAPPAPAGKPCFNAHCKESRTEGGGRRRAWRLRSGDFADICERCYIPFELGNFCETFHSDVPGWRNCETCGKRLHCGCIVSAYAYVLLDAGGVDCYMCSRRSTVTAPSQSWSSSLNATQQSYDRKDGLAKTFRAPTGSFPSHWRANSWSINSELQQRLAFEFDRPAGEKLQPVRSFIHAAEKKYDDVHDRVTPSIPSMHSGFDLSHQAYPYNFSHRDVGTVSDHASAMPSRFNLDARSNSSQSQSILRQQDSAGLGLASSSTAQLPNGSNDVPTISSRHPHELTAASATPRQYSSQSTFDSEQQVHVRSGRPRADAKARSNQPLPRYWPRITDQELQQISGDSNSVITPLFEKVLSVSDAGKVGRLVLPKKCAEAYLPAISQPEGIPLKVHDASGVEWNFQFRFWPNNNSRMYVLEGVTNCIQSMQLQAGDTVTFSRVDPGRKLVMGFRKASNLSYPEQDNQIGTSANGSMTALENNDKSLAEEKKPNTVVSSNEEVVDCDSKTELKSSLNALEQNTKTEIEKGTSHLEDGSAIQPSLRPPKRRGSSLALKLKRLRVEREESIDMDITWQETQNLLRAPSNKSPCIVVVEDHGFEEYEEPPVVGRKAHLVRNREGNMQLWAQCENCFKWRRLPADFLLPSNWTCADNKWDPSRSSCSYGQELTNKQLAKLISQNTGDAKKSRPCVNADSVISEGGLDTLANLAILGEGESLPPVVSKSPPTTRHPRHRPGCSCIVCIQPPSGKGPKHMRNCMCNVCATVRRRFKTLMTRREKHGGRSLKASRKQSRLFPKREAEAEEEEDDEEEPSASPVPVEGTPSHLRNTSSPPKVKKEPAEEAIELCKSPVKNHIDLNMQPEREEGQSPKSDAAGGECTAGEIPAHDTGITDTEKVDTSK